MCRLALASLALGALLAGCATAYSRGEEALHAGRYAEAAREFEAAAASGGKRLDALTVLGIARYRLGDFTRAGNAAPGAGGGAEERRGATLRGARRARAARGRAGARGSRGAPPTATLTTPLPVGRGFGATSGDTEEPMTAGTVEAE